MFKEKSTEKLIAYIQTLPQKEQTLIVEHIAGAASSKVKKKTAVTHKAKKRGVKEMGAFLDKLGTRLPKNYKFNREEANER